MTVWYTTIVCRVHFRHGGGRVCTHRVVCQLPPRFGDPVAPEGHADRCLYEVLNRAFQLDLEHGVPLRIGLDSPISAVSEDTSDSAALNVQKLLQLFDAESSDDNGENGEDDAIEPISPIDVGIATILREFENLMNVDERAADAVLNSLRGKYELRSRSSGTIVAGKRTAASSGLQEINDRAQKRANMSCVPARGFMIIPALLHDNDSLCKLRTSCKECCLSMADVWNYRYLQQYLKGGRSVNELLTPSIRRCQAVINKFGDSVMSDIKKAFAHFAPMNEITAAQRADVKYGVSLVECITIHCVRSRSEAGSDLYQLYLDGSFSMMAQLHELICDVLTHSNLPEEVRNVCCSFLEYETGLSIPASTWQILRQLFNEGSLLIKGIILRIARGSDAISDEAIVHALMMMTKVNHVNERLFTAVMQYYIKEPHTMLVDFLKPWTRGRKDLLSRSDAFRRLVMHMSTSE